LPLAWVISAAGPTWAQSSYSPVVITPPIVDEVDDNHVSMFSGKPQFTIPALKLGDVSFTPYSYNGEHFVQSGLADQNYGRIVACLAVNGTTSFGGSFECAVANGDAMQVIYGQERATFHLTSGQYTPDARDGSTFVDNGTSCTWTKTDGTRIVFAAYHDAGNPLCLRQNIMSITYPDGRIATYYYYGAFSTTAQSPILSIATTTGYLLKYNYSGTPAFGSETSVTAINRAFETCDPSATSCTLSGSWPTANVSWQPLNVSPSCDNFPSLGGGYSSCTHYIFTIEEATHKKHIFQLDSYFRTISYQPPGATSAVFNYTLCSNLVGGSLINCFGYPQYPWHPQVFEPQPMMFDLVASVTRNGQVWNYSPFFTPGSPPQGPSTWTHYVGNPLNKTRSASGNATPGTELYWGPIENLSEYNGIVYNYERSVQNTLGLVTMPSGIKKGYIYGVRRNVTQITQTPLSGSGLSVLTQSATYSEPSANPCSNLVTCNKPTSVVDANGNQTDFTYDSTHGGILTETDPPAPNGIRPQIRRSYVQRYAWYLNSAGTMTRETNPVWLLSTESYCRVTAASGSGCTTPSDEVVTSYDYGPDSGPNNLMLRGKTVTGDGLTLRTCYAHDHQGNVIWQTSPNANPASCPTY